MTIPTDHECEREEVCDGVLVALHFNAIRPLCPQHDERTVRELIQQHAEAITAHIVSAGMEAAVRLFNGQKGMS